MRQEIRQDEGGRSGEALLDEVDKRMQDSGLGEPLEKIAGGWQPSDAERLGFGEAGAAVLKAASNIADAASPEYLRTLSRQHHREIAGRALKSLSEEERKRVRGELMRTGQRMGEENEYSRIEQQVWRDERAEAAQERIGEALRRAEQMEGENQIRRAEALDEAQERFEGLDGPVQERVREGLGSGLEEQLEEALREGRSSASDLREQAAEQSSQNRGESQGSQEGSSTGQSEDENKGQDEDESSGQGYSRGYDRGMGF